MFLHATSTLGLPNTIRLQWPSVTAKPMKRHFQCAEQPWDCQTQSNYLWCDCKNYFWQKLPTIWLPEQHRTSFSVQNRFPNARSIQTPGTPAASSRERHLKQTCVDNSSSVMRPKLPTLPAATPIKHREPICLCSPTQLCILDLAPSFLTPPETRVGNPLERAVTKSGTSVMQI